MELWEVIKATKEDPTKVYKNENGYSVKFTDEGILAWFDDSGKTVNKNTAYDWQLVRQPVTWQEAIQAWADGKKVSYKYSCDEAMYAFQDSNRMLSIEKIKEAAWYVED